MKKNISVEELKMLQLEILDSIDDFCKKNEIQYSRRLHHDRIYGKLFLHEHGRLEKYRPRTQKDRLPLFHRRFRVGVFVLRRAQGAACGRT